MRPFKTPGEQIKLTPCFVFTQTLQVPLNEAVEDAPIDSEKWEFNICVGASGYLFMRIYHVLCERLAQADALCQSVDRDPTKTVGYM